MTVATLMHAVTIEPIRSHLAWTFNQVLPGSFKRVKGEYAHHNYPVLGPPPMRCKRGLPRQGAGLQGPFFYLVVNAQGQVRYVGKSKEKHVLKRCIRPSVGGPASYY